MPGTAGLKVYDPNLGPSTKNAPRFTKSAEFQVFIYSFREI